MNPILLRLRRLRLDYSPSAASDREQLLQALGRTRLRPVEIVQAHDLLLFFLAHPDCAANVRHATQALRRITQQAARHGESAELCNTGIFGTRCAYAFTIDLLHWLATTCGRELGFDWDDESWFERFDDFLQSAVLRVSADAVLNGSLSTKEVVTLFAKRCRLGAVGWFTRELTRAAASGGVLDRAFDSLELAVEWRIRWPEHSLGSLRLSKRRPHLVKQLNEPVDLRAEVTRPIPHWRRLTRAEATRAIDQARWTLCLRGRETDPVTYANPAEVYRCELERGVEIFLYTLLPERRLPIESYIGYVAARCGVPIAYGGAWVFGPRAEIGLNIFDAFRGGESAFLFAQLMRVYAQLFGASQFIVPPYQLGDDNEEGLHSGAYWFYYRLGFRPAKRALRVRADREVQRRRANRRYRTGTAAMKELVAEPVSWRLDPAARRVDLDVARLGTVVAHSIGARFEGDQGRAELQSARRLQRIVGGTKLSAAEQASVRFFAPLAVLVGNLRGWSAAERAQLARILALKRGGRERDFVLAIQRHPRLVASFERLLKRPGRR